MTMVFQRSIVRTVALMLTLWFALARMACAEQVASEEFDFSVEKPSGEDWKMTQNGVIGDKGSPYKVVFVNRADNRVITLMVMPAKGAALKSADGTDLTEPSEDVRKGFETSFFASDKKVSSESCKLAGLSGFRCVGLKKLPSGDERYSVGVFVVYKQRSYIVGGLCREPWPKDKELTTFIDSITIGPKKTQK